jgi:hypothetical protein
MPSDKQEAAIKIGLFCKVLDGIPVNAVEDACVEWLKNHAERGDAPTPAGIAFSAKKLLGYYKPCGMEGVGYDVDELVQLIKGIVNKARVAV